MGKKRSFLLLLLLVVPAASYVVEGDLAYRHYQQDGVAIQEQCGGFSPVRVCVHAPRAVFSAFYRSYVDAHTPLFMIDYSSSEPIELQLRVSITGFTQQETRTVTATANTQFWSFIPPPQDQALQQLTSEKSTLLHVEATDTRGRMYYKSDTPLLLHSRRLMQWTTANRLKIAAWVTPEDPAVVQLVERAVTHLQDQIPPLPRGFIGYKATTEQEVVDQVDAIYDTLRLNYHIRYIQDDMPDTALADENAATQEIKLPAEILQEQSGMGIELITLLAAAIEHIELHPEIVIIPGHAFLGVAVNEHGTRFEYWDMVDINKNIAGDSANVQADNLYLANAHQHAIVDTIRLSDARQALIGPMLL